MKLKLQPYYLPVKTNKCKNCYRHDHLTNQCSSKQLCIRCGQHHSSENGCQHEFRCVNCQQSDCFGRSSCPVVQEERKIIAEQKKMQRAQLIIPRQQSFEYNNIAFPCRLFFNSCVAVTRSDHSVTQLRVVVSYSP